MKYQVKWQIVLSDWKEVEADSMADAVDKVESWACMLSANEIRSMKDYVYYDASVRIKDWEES